MQVHKLIQGTPEWLAHRATGYNGKPFFNASDAPAMMGCSPYKTRSQLLHEMATGQVPEADLATKRRFAEGHRIEALARPLAQKIIGEDLYPITGSEDRLSASFDGLTMAEDQNFEHKTINDELRAAFDSMETLADADKAIDLPLQYRVQMEQQHMVSGCTRTLFMASKWDGDTLVEEQHCWYYTDMALRAKIAAGWAQFAIDLSAYVPPEVIVAPVAAPQMGLPAVAIQVTGSIALVDNLDKFGTALTAYIERINKKPETDQDFADLEATVKTLKTAEDALDAAEAGALAQTDSIDTMRKTVAMYRDTARANRLLIEKLVKAEKENRRTAIVGDAVAELVTHVKKLNERLGKPYMPSITGDFQGVIKGLKSLDSMKDKVATELARCKIAANEAADRIQVNLTTLRDLAKDHVFLFSDTHQLVQKANDDLTVLVMSRIAEYKAAELAKEEATRERIRAEEQAFAAAAELAAAKASEGAELSPAAQALYDSEGAANFAKAHPKVTHDTVVKIMMPPAVRQAIATKPETPPTLKLGVIAERMGFTLTADFLKVLGFEPAATDRASKLYHEEDFPSICQALIAHVAEVSEQFEQVAA